MKDGPAADHIVTDLACGEMAPQQGFAKRIDAQLAGTAIVINLVASVRAEKVGEWDRIRTHGVSVDVERRAIRPDDVVVDERMTIGAREQQVPVRRQAALEARTGIERVECVWLGPRLKPEHHRWINRRRYDCAAQQLIAGFRALHFVLVFELGHQLRLRSEMPTAIRGANPGPFVGAVDVGMHVYASRSDEKAGIAMESRSKEF